MKEEADVHTKQLQALQTVKHALSTEVSLNVLGFNMKVFNTLQNMFILNAMLFSLTL